MYLYQGYSLSDKRWMQPVNNAQPGLTNPSQDISFVYFPRILFSDLSSNELHSLCRASGLRALRSLIYPSMWTISVSVKWVSDWTLTASSCSAENMLWKWSNWISWGLAELKVYQLRAKRFVYLSVLDLFIFFFSLYCYVYSTRKISTEAFINRIKFPPG